MTVAATRPAKVAPLVPAALRWRCDPASLGFVTTSDVAPLDTVVGQERGITAIDLALDIDDPEYNLFVAGPSGSGRNSAVVDLVRRAAARRTTAQDVCYLHGFKDPYRPVVVALPAGTGPALAGDLDDLVARCRTDLPRVFEGPEYEERRSRALAKTNEQRERMLRDLAAAAEQLGFTIEIGPMGVVSTPLVDGKPLSSDAFELLPDDRKRQIATGAATLKVKIDQTVSTLRALDREGHQSLHSVDREIALYAVGHLLEDLRAKYAAYAPVVAHLDAVQNDIVEHLYEFRSVDEAQSDGLLDGPRPWTRYGLNVLVTREPGSGAPVELEPNPTLTNLIGRVDYRAGLGAMHTDFRYIRAGSLHRANGGYLVIQARDLLTSPYSYEALKRALRDHEVRIENPIEQLGGFPAATLKPEPVPLRVRVVLIGDPAVYRLLRMFDPDFERLFKIKAEFTPFIERTPDSVHSYAAFIAKSARERGLPPFSAEAVARIVEEGARIVAHQERLASRLGVVEEILVEAAERARRNGAETVRATDVREAIAARRRRANLIEDEMQRAIVEGTVAIDTRSSVVGQVNALSVIDLGDYAFARPSRITARTGPGADGVVDIEREVELSGPTHSKGVLILSGYLLGTYGQRHPLALSAQLTFEQSYGGVEGDSASVSELLAILSSLADVPIQQAIAITGSVDQRGHVQAVGGVNEKIEGHFAVCRAQGLTGAQGVIVPKANTRHLMLDDEVVDAVARGRFHIWAVECVDEAIALVTGLAPGERARDGSFPAGSFHERVQRTLEGYARVLAEYARTATRTPAS